MFVASSSFAQIPGITTFATLSAGNQPLSLLDSSFSAVANYINGAAINASYYGVKCDGTTDDTAALNAAVLAVHNLTSGAGGILNITIPVLIAAAIVVFFWGLVQYIRKSGEDKGEGAAEEARPVR